MTKAHYKKATVLITEIKNFEDLLAELKGANKIKIVKEELQKGTEQTVIEYGTKTSVGKDIYDVVVAYHTKQLADTEKQLAEL